MFRSSLAARGVIVAGSLAHLAGKAFRIGHMGNTSIEQLEKAIQLMGEVLIEQGVQVKIEHAVDVLHEELKSYVK